MKGSKSITQNLSIFKKKTDTFISSKNCGQSLRNVAYELKKVQNHYKGSNMQFKVRRSIYIVFPLYEVKFRLVTPCINW